MQDAGYMRMALSLAKKGAGKTSPNPAVGAVLVKGGRVIGKGYHKKAGLPHAEIEAIKSAKEDVRGATLYVTLEPCCHWGRTPPCTDALKRAGIREVVIGHKDPNPKVSGKGISALKAAGIKAAVGVLEDKCRKLNEAYIKYITTGAPFVTLKLASSLDGRIATVTGASRWITCPESRARAHRLRAMSDAVMVGVNTVVKDDPELTVRLAKGKNPVRVVTDSTLRTPLAAKVFAGTEEGRLIIYTTKKASQAKVKKAVALGAVVVSVGLTNGGVAVREVIADLGRRGVVSLLVEGGSMLSASLLSAGLVDKLCFFMSPGLIGGDGAPAVASLGVKDPAKAPFIHGMTITRSGKDMLVEGYFKGI